VEVVGTTIDLAYRRRDADGTRKAIDWCEQLKSRKWQARLSQKQQGELLYFEANAWSDLEGLSKRGQPEEWDWAQEEITNELVCLRTVLRSESLFNVQGPVRKCQILTNLANTLSRVGRTVEALDYWTRALDIDPQFGMALGNRAKGLYTYSRLLYDPGHQTILLRKAGEDLDAALRQDFDDEPRASFLALREQIVGILGKVDSGRAVAWDRYSLGRSRP
jgi:tetratricopeptide (TPR) repeat protein